MTAGCKDNDKFERRDEWRKDPANYLKIQTRLGIPKLFRGSRTIDFDENLMWPISSMSMLVCGADTGVGKTHYAAAALTKWLIDENENYCNVQFVNVANLMLELRDTFKSKKLRELDVVNKLSKLKFLVLDDFGAEKFSEYSLTSLYAIINNRLCECRPTVVTTNLNLEEIHGADPRLASRFSAYEHVYLTGEDRRVKK